MTARFRVPARFDTFDRMVDERWEALRSMPGSDRVFYSASEAANFSMIWHSLALAKAVATRDPKAMLKTSAALGIEAALVNGPIKSMFERERPQQEERPRKLRDPKTSSFPSGHASAATVAYMFLKPGLSRPAKAVLGTTSFVVATSRVHVRIHHASDVIAGAATGYGLAKLLRPVVGSIFGGVSRRRRG